MKKIFALLFLLLILPLVANAAQVKEISPAQVYALLKEGSGLWLVDVRGPLAFESVHIEGAVNIAPNRLVTKTFPKNKMIILADSSIGETAARKAAETLLKNGQKRVFVLAGGLKGWRGAKLPMVGDNPEWELSRVYPGELAAALESKTALQIFDLRAKETREGRPVENALAIDGKSIDEQLDAVQKRLAISRKAGLAANLKQLPATVVILPIVADAQTLYDRYLRRLPEDVRIIEGGYLVTEKRRGRESVRTGDGCATCPGG
ncbi:MAG: rhodanese-like domain-containing protein [Desulfuromonadales bacterium]|nr:rhodanese-like domain-containing protein [Desulfuromonadales bacterium]